VFEKILIANRGEIALRIHRACREMGIETVAVHSTADEDAMHVRLADESVCIGPPPSRDSYLNVAAILSAATITGADAIHPGVGFLAENADFAAMVAEHGFVFIGPEPAHIALMGDKVTAKEAAQELGLPVVPGSDGAINSEAQARETALSIGYPVLIKAAAGGGGRGMKIAHNAEQLPGQLKTARAEAKASFANDQHLGERDCSLQRRFQKLVEEAPSPALNADERDTVGRLVVEAVEKLGYRSAGTVEFLYENGEFYFIEMNTRLQVEHPISEAITGVDLVREQIRVAAGVSLGLRQQDIAFTGHAIECRINAEDPFTFTPSPGTVSDYHAPGGLGVRVDSGLYAGYTVPPHYDSLIAKLIVHGQTRNECLMRLRRALEEFVIDGIATTIPLHQQLIGDNDFINGEYDINWLEGFLSRTQG
jgi:acetyl-CoA carboxylase biotin carboxylase subunit